MKGRRPDGHPCRQSTRRGRSAGHSAGAPAAIVAFSTCAARRAGAAAGCGGSRAATGAGGHAPAAVRLVGRDASIGAAPGIVTVARLGSLNLAIAALARGLTRLTRAGAGLGAAPEGAPHALPHRAFTIAPVLVAPIELGHPPRAGDTLSAPVRTVVGAVLASDGRAGVRLCQGAVIDPAIRIREDDVLVDRPRRRERRHEPHEERRVFRRFGRVVLIPSARLEAAVDVPIGVSDRPGRLVGEVGPVLLLRTDGLPPQGGAVLAGVIAGRLEESARVDGREVSQHLRVGEHRGREGIGEELAAAVAAAASEQAGAHPVDAPDVDTVLHVADEHGELGGEILFGRAGRRAAHIGEMQPCVDVGVARPDVGRPRPAVGERVLRRHEVARDRMARVIEAEVTRPGQGRLQRGCVGARSLQAGQELRLQRGGREHGLVRAHERRTKGRARVSGRRVDHSDHRRETPA